MIVMPTKRPLSQLRYDRIQSGTGPTVITLHKHNQYSTGIADLARAVAPDATILGLESFKGIFVSRDIVGYTWYVGPIDRPAPVFFGDSLAEIERFLWDFLDWQESDAPKRPFLLGIEQGAIMALATALAVPDLLSGVIAVDGALPIVPGWDPPLAPLDGLPVLLTGDLGGSPGHPQLHTTELARQFALWGGTSTYSDEADQIKRERMIRTWLTAQPVRNGYPSSGQ